VETLRTIIEYMDLSDLPSFRINGISSLVPLEAGGASLDLTGCVSHVSNLEVGSRYWMFTNDRASPLVDIMSMDVANQIATLSGLTFRDSPDLAIGDEYPLITNYWNAYIYTAVLDPHRQWTRRLFTPIGAFETGAQSGDIERSTPTRPGKRRIYPGRQAMSDGVRVVDSGWDHEHCAICNGHIDETHPRRVC